MSGRPVGLSALWSWALSEHERAVRAVPHRIHAHYYPPVKPGDTDGDAPKDTLAHPEDVIRGLPFTRAFERYIEGPGEAKMDQTSCRRALASMHARGASQSPEYWIAFAAVEIGHDIEIARVLLRMSPAFFNRCAERSLALLWDLTQTMTAVGQTDTQEGRKPAA